MPKQSESQAIGIDAEKIFEILLSSRLWNIQKIPQERDYGLDHRVENIRNGDLQGSGFLSRIKGFSKIDSNKDISISIKTDTLEYWKEKLLSVLKSNRNLIIFLAIGASWGRKKPLPPLLTVHGLQLSVHG